MTPVLAQLGYTTTLVTIGCAILGAAAGLTGALAVLRKRALLADTVAHATLPGVAAAFIAATLLGVSGQSLPLLLVGAAISGTLGAIATHTLTRVARLTEDAAMAVVLSTFFGLGVVLLTAVQHLRTAGQAGLSRFILGQAAALSEADVVTMVAVALAAAAAVVVLYKELRLLCFDRAYAAAIGRRVDALDLLLLALLTIVSVAGLQAVGLIMVVALQIIPAAAARFCTDRFWPMLALSALFGAVAGLVGAFISTLAPGMPTGAWIVLVAGAIFTATVAVASFRAWLHRRAPPAPEGATP